MATCCEMTGLSAAMLFLVFAVIFGGFVPEYVVDVMDSCPFDLVGSLEPERTVCNGLIAKRYCHFMNRILASTDACVPPCPGAQIDGNLVVYHQKGNPELKCAKSCNEPTQRCPGFENFVCGTCLPRDGDPRSSGQF